jgi:N utilization substance protein A
LSEKIAEQLLESGVTTVEKLGSMTPEQLEEIPGIEPELVEKIQLAVNAYYGQFETGGQPVEAAGAAERGVAVTETSAEGSTQKDVEPGAGETASAEGAGVDEAAAPETAEPESTKTEPNAEPVADEFDTIKDSRQGAEGGGAEAHIEDGKVDR